jgi:hypothetical protein
MAYSVKWLPASLDHLVGTGEQRERHGKTSAFAVLATTPKTLT